MSNLKMNILVEYDVYDVQMLLHVLLILPCDVSTLGDICLNAMIDDDKVWDE